MDAMDPVEGESPTTIFGALLRSFRHRAKLTIEELSYASGVSARAISNMEEHQSPQGT
ncbi:helix-turn-helix domain-containing protein [Nonomuraea sp. NPDC001699]